jgi:hypothetical protein
MEPKKEKEEVTRLEAPTSLTIGNLDSPCITKLANKQGLSAGKRPFAGGLSIGTSNICIFLY